MTTPGDVSIRIISIYATKWRYVGDQPNSLLDHLALGELAATYEPIKDQLPRPLVRRDNDVAGVALGELEGRARLISSDSWLFALPSDQTLAAFRFDLSVSGEDLPAIIDTVLDSCVNLAVRVDGEDLDSYVARLATSPPARDILAVLDADGQAHGPESSGFEDLPLLQERHQIVFVPTADTVDQGAVQRILYRRTAPYRSEFVREQEATGLHEAQAAPTGRKIGLITPYVSLIGGHDQAVENSVFLSTIQIVGTAARFRQIWHESYTRVREFRRDKQRAGVDMQVRADLKHLVDRLGNLEFDLTFSVEFPLMHVESFHTALYEVMELEKQAKTLSQMFTQLAGSIQSELTAIDIRERDVVEERERMDETIQRQYERAAFAPTVVLIPIGLLLTFFGINAREVSNDFSLLSMHYWYAYAAAFLVGLVSYTAALRVRRNARKMRAGVREK